MAGILSLTTAFHLVAAAHYYFTLHFMATKFTLPQTEKFQMFNSFGGHYRFLTNWNLILQSLFFTVCLLNDLFGSNEIIPRKTPLIRKVKDYFHASIGFPLAAFVAITFWGIYAVDRELVFPKALDPYFPTWLNHIMHTNVLVFTVIELIISFRFYPSRKSGLTGVSAVMLAYLVWTIVIFVRTEKWVYPVLDVLNWPQRIAFLGVLVVFSIILYFLGEGLNKLIWRKVLAKEAIKRNDDVAPNSAELKTLCSNTENGEQAKN